MNIFESISSALSGILGNKTRSILTMFGIIVGIGSVIMISSIGEGYKQSIQKQFEEVGLDRLTLRVDGNSSEIKEYDRLTTKDVEILRQYEGVTAASGMYWIYFSEAFTLLDGNKTRSLQLYGVDRDYFQIEKKELLHGRYIAKQDVDNETMSVIIDEDFAVQVFGRADVVGQKLTANTYFGSQKFDIVGVTKSDDMSQLYALYNVQAIVYAPITTVQNSFYQESYVDEIRIKAADVNDLNGIAANIVRLMEFHHENEGKYNVDIYADNLSEANTVIGLFTVFMGLVAGISLLVGGIGVMNIMLVSVTERTREIGIRKSLGATNGNIKFQFLVEAMILTALGGAFGILFGYLGGIGIGQIASMLMGETIIPYMSQTTIIIAFGFSAAIGIIFGVYPAVQAAKLDPVEALRFE